MNSELKIQNFKKGKLISIMLIAIGQIAKLILLPVKTGDYIGFLQPWINFINDHGYFSSLKYGFYDYSPSYIYILIIIAKIGLNPLYSVKFVSIAFEYLAAFFVGKIAFEKTNNKLMMWISFAIIPILPTVLLNSSYLSQCDSIYSVFILGSIYFILKKKQFLSVLFLAIAFAFKMQAVIILPFYFVMLLRGNIRWYYFLLIPFIFILSVMPAWYFGRPLTELLNIYLVQTGRFRYLTLNFPNIYIWINNSLYEPIRIVGIVFTFLLTLFSCVWLSRKQYFFSFNSWINFAFLCAIIIPYLLPGMHERYMYLGDLLGVLYYLVNRKNIQLPLGILLVSFYSYIRCSKYNDVLPMSPAFLIYSLVIIFTFIAFIKTLKTESNEIRK